MNMNRCIRINLATRAPGVAIPAQERAATLLDIATLTAQIGARADFTDLFFPKVYINDGLADHRAWRDALCEFARQHALRVQG